MSSGSPQARAKRIAAARARRLAQNLFDDDRKRVLAFAQDLEAEATELEREATVVLPPVSHQHVQQQQHQQQQQQQQQQRRTCGPGEKSDS